MTIELAKLTGLANMVAPNGGSTLRAQSLSPADAQTGATNDSSTMKSAASVIQDYLSAHVQPPTFNVDYLSGVNVMIVRSADNGEVVMQMPGPAALRLAQLIKEGSPLVPSAIVSETA